MPNDSEANISEVFIPDEARKLQVTKELEEQVNQFKTQITSFVETSSTNINPEIISDLALSLAMTNISNSEMIHISSSIIENGSNYEQAIEKVNLRKSEELDVIRESYNNIISSLDEEQVIKFNNFLDELTDDHGMGIQVKSAYRLPDELYVDLIRFQSEYPKRSDELLALSYLVMGDEKFIPDFTDELMSSSKKDIALLKENSDLIEPNIMEAIDFRQNEKKTLKTSQKASLSEINAKLKSSPDYAAPDLDEMQLRKPEMVMHPGGVKKPWNKYKKLIVQSTKFNTLPQEIQDSLIKFQDTPIKLEHYEFIEEPLKEIMKKEAMKELHIQYNTEKAAAIKKAEAMIETVGFGDLPFEEKRATVEFLNKKIEIYTARKPSEKDLEKFNSIADIMVDERLELAKEESRDAYLVERKEVREYTRKEAQEFSANTNRSTPEKSSIKKQAQDMRNSLSTAKKSIHFEAPPLTKTSQGTKLER